MLADDPIPVMFKRIETKLYPLCVELDFDREETKMMMEDRFGYKVKFTVLCVMSGLRHKPGRVVCACHRPPAPRSPPPRSLCAYTSHT